jgi:hypothetical protein
MNNHRTWLSVAILSAIFATNANAQTEIDKLRSCLTIEDGSKERLDCYDGIIPPDPKPKPPVAKRVADCKFLKEEDERLGCFNRLVQPAATHKAVERSLRRFNRQNEPPGRERAEGEVEMMLAASDAER